MEALHAELNEKTEVAPSSYSATTIFFLQYNYSVLLAKNHQKSRSRCLVQEFSFTDIFQKYLLWLQSNYIEKNICSCVCSIWL